MGTTANTYYDSSKAGVAHGSDHNANCCSTKALCSTLTCAAGYKSKTNAASIYCSSKTCTTATDGATCCDADITKCGGTVQVTCTYGNTAYFWDSAKAGTAFGSTVKATACCTAKSTCPTAYPAASGNTGTSGTTSGSSKIEPPYYRIVAVLLAGLL